VPFCDLIGEVEIAFIGLGFEQISFGRLYLDLQRVFIEKVKVIVVESHPASGIQHESVVVGDGVGVAFKFTDVRGVHHLAAAADRNTGHDDKCSSFPVT
jgi:hypothetical protein